eukprot:contig_12746_g3041
MDSLIAISGRDFVLMASDVTSARSIVVMKEDMDKIMELDEHKLLGFAGEPGDCTAFTEYIQKNVHLFALRSGITLDTHAVGNFTRNELAVALRKRPYNANMLLAGYDEHVGPSLYYLDYLATLHKMDFSALGYASFFVLSTLDRHWKKNMSVDEALVVLKKCIKEVQTRMIISQPKFTIKLVGKDGIQVLEAASSVADEKKVTSPPPTMEVEAAAGVVAGDAMESA